MIHAKLSTLLNILFVFVFVHNKIYSQELGKQPIEYVNTFIGTAPLTNPDQIGYTPPKDWRVWAGLTYPGSSLPNAMVQLSPITEYGSGAGYEYEDSEILGFTHTNKGHWNLCNIPVLPLSGVDASQKENRKSSFSHENEAAQPGYYQVYLDDFDVDVQLTSTLRSGFHRYTFRNQENRQILFDLSRANNRVHEWDAQINDDQSIAGYQDIGGDRIHFYATIDHSITNFQLQKDEGNEYAIITISNESEKPVHLRIGLSFVSVENAQENLKNEIGEQSFEEIKEEASQKWNKLLNNIQVQGGSEKEKELFFSSLYRSFLWPALRSDANGDFIAEDKTVHNTGFRYYTNPSFWDTYRNKLVLLSILQPEVTNDVIKSLIHKGEITGFIPTFFHGDHAAAFISGTHQRGIGDFDAPKVYELLLNNAYKEGGSRLFIQEYIEKGFISDPDVENPHVETKAKAGVSKTLEYAYDDYALSLLAKKMGDEEHVSDLRRRAGNYRNVFDSATNFMRGRLENGDWISPFNPQYPYYEYMYREANAWQVSFYVPHDMQGLIQLYGGNQAFEEKLDSLFSTPWNPAHIARNVSGFLGQYCHGNQPGHEAPYSYYFIGKPEKSQKIIDKLLAKYYGIGEYGLALSGMDDAGEMSSWYVFAAAGLYPFSPADPEYLISVPLFDEVKFIIDGQSFVIKKDGNSRELKEIKINNNHSKTYMLSHEDFRNGGTMAIVTK